MRAVLEAEFSRRTLTLRMDRVNIIVQRLVREGRLRMEGPQWVVQ